MKTVEKQEEIIDAQQYKDEFFGSFVSLIVEEIKNKSMAMAGTTTVLDKCEQYIPEEEKQEYNSFTNIAKNSTHELCELADAINIGSESISVSSLNDILAKLLKIDLIMKMAKLNFKFENAYTMLKCNPKILVYILIEAIRFLISQNINQIDLLCDEEDAIVKIKVCHKIEDDNLYNKINKLAVLDENITIETEYDQIIIKL